jgi:hypothetical protein
MADSWAVLRMSQSASVAGSTLSLSFSALQPPTQVIVTEDGGRVLDGSAHLKSRALVNQSASVTGCTLSVSHIKGETQNEDQCVRTRRDFIWFRVANSGQGTEPLAVA